VRVQRLPRYRFDPKSLQLQTISESLKKPFIDSVNVNGGVHIQSGCSPISQHRFHSISIIPDVDISRKLINQTVHPAIFSNVRYGRRIYSPTGNYWRTRQSEIVSLRAV
jgi:hypothetical protein